MNQMMQKYLYRDAQSDVQNILFDLFSNCSEVTTKHFMSLKPIEFEVTNSLVNDRLTHDKNDDRQMEI